MLFRQRQQTVCIDRSSHHIGLVILSAYSSIYSKAEDYKTEHTLALNTKQKLMPAASLSILSHCQVPQLRTAFADNNLLKMMPLFDQLLIANLLNCKFPYYGTFLCVTHDHHFACLLCHHQSCTLYSEAPHLWIFPPTLEPNFRCGL